MGRRFRAARARFGGLGLQGFLDWGFHMILLKKLWRKNRVVAKIISRNEIRLKYPPGLPMKRRRKTWRSAAKKSRRGERRAAP
jgi:hypothetical protein